MSLRLSGVYPILGTLLCYRLSAAQTLLCENWLAPDLHIPMAHPTPLWSDYNTKYQENMR